VLPIFYDDNQTEYFIFLQHISAIFIQYCSKVCGQFIIIFFKEINTFNQQGCIKSIK